MPSRSAVRKDRHPPRGVPDPGGDPRDPPLPRELQGSPLPGDPGDGGVGEVRTAAGSALADASFGPSPDRRRRAEDHRGTLGGSGAASADHEPRLGGGRRAGASFRPRKRARVHPARCSAAHVPPARACPQGAPGEAAKRSPRRSRGGGRSPGDRSGTSRSGSPPGDRPLHGRWIFRPGVPRIAGVASFPRGEGGEAAPPHLRDHRRRTGCPGVAPSAPQDVEAGEPA